MGFSCWHTNIAGNRRHWGEWCSVDLGFCQIKEEIAGRGAFAEPFTLVSSVTTSLCLSGLQTMAWWGAI